MIKGRRGRRGAVPEQGQAAQGLRGAPTASSASRSSGRAERLEKGNCCLCGRGETERRGVRSERAGSWQRSSPSPGTRASSHGSAGAGLPGVGETQDCGAVQGPRLGGTRGAPGMGNPFPRGTGTRGHGEEGRGGRQGGAGEAGRGVDGGLRPKICFSGFGTKLGLSFVALLAGEMLSGLWDDAHGQKTWTTFGPGAEHDGSSAGTAALMLSTTENSL